VIPSLIPSLISSLRPHRSVQALVLLFVCVPAFLSAQDVYQAVYDVVIRNGRILDGTGNPWFLGDVAIQGERVAAIGDLSGAAGRREVDATGLFVAPGFIDSHSHAGPGLATPGLSHGEPLLAQGLTTVMINPDGGGPVDLARQKTELLEHGMGVNVTQFVPHGSLRREIVGDGDRAPNAAEMDQMRGAVRQGMQQGAFGLSSGTFYAPGSFAEPDEIVELARVVAEFGGAYTSHIRDEASYTVGVMEAVEEVIDVGRKAGVPAVITHIKALGPTVWGFGHAIVQRIERARAEGVEVYSDQYPYIASSTGLGAALLPRWAQAGGADSLKVRLNRPETFARIRMEMVENLARRGGADRIQFRRAVFDESLEGRRLSDVATEKGEDPVDYAADLLRRGSVSIISYNMQDDDVRTLMVQPWNMTSSDGGLAPMGEGVPHPRSYGAFARKIRYYVVEEGVVDLAAAIRSMTSLPAQVFRIPDRGTLREGAFADIVVFDLARVNDPATFTEPHQLSEGMVEVFVNGQAAMSGGEFTALLPGRVLQRR
jgi:N-acyl-D-amino-acid deacylase